jgi:hypothetical protein
MAFADPARNWPEIPIPPSLPVQPAALGDFLVRIPFPTSAVVVRKHCFEVVGGFDTSLRNAEDRDLFIRIGDRYPIVRLGAVLVWGGRDGEHLSMGSATAEQATRKMILGAFERVESLRGRFRLRRRALSQAAFHASYMYMVKGYRLRALHRVLWSFLLWPFTLPGEEGRPFRRFKRLVRILVS